MSYTKQNADADLAVLRGLMRDRNKSGPYWSGPSATRLQAAYRAIVEFQAGGPEPTFPNALDLQREDFQAVLRNPPERAKYFRDEAAQAELRRVIAQQEEQ